MSAEALERARLWLRASRHSEAGRELRGALADDPERAELHALLALVHAGEGRTKESLACARRAIALAPEDAYAHRVLGAILHDLEREEEGLVEAREAVRLAPNDPDHHALLAMCSAGLARWAEARAAAERGLALDPSHADCLLQRALALRQLREPEPASTALRLALASHPEDADVHASTGIDALSRGDVDAALRHTREALRLAPEDERARFVLGEALKARNPLYRRQLRVLLWVTRWRLRRVVLALVGTGIVVAFVASFSYVLLGSLLVLEWIVWVGPRLYELALWLRRDTRHVLTAIERRAALLTGATVAAAPLGGALLWALGDGTAALLVLLGLLATALPVAWGLSLEDQRARLAGAGIAAACVALGLGGTCFAAAEAVLASVTGAENPSRGLPLLALAIAASFASSLVLFVLTFVRAR